MKFEHYTLPAHLASALLNNDYSGLSDDDENELDDWVTCQADNYPLFYCTGCSEEAEFKTSNDMNNLGADCLDYCFQVGA